MKMNHKQVLEIQKRAEEKLDDVYAEYFPKSQAPKLSPGIISAVMGAAIEAGFIEET